MPIKIPDNLPGRAALEHEHVPLILEHDALRQDIRPLQILILNLMPDKITTETQLLRAIGLSPLQIEVTLMHMSSHVSKNTSAEHLAAFYQAHDEIKHRKFDGMIVTGAPVEQLDYKDVAYWPELTGIFEWARTHVYSSLFICWGAMAGLYHYNRIAKTMKPRKLSGIYPHKILHYSPLVAGLDDAFDVPVSRHTGLDEAAIAADAALEIIAASPLAGAFIIKDAAARRTFVLNHLEYDAETIMNEYQRDLAAGLDPDIPYNYFPQNNPNAAPAITWRAHRTLLFTNWINSVYQTAPFSFTA
jgi:homoserine O-succinyltransferase